MPSRLRCLYHGRLERRRGAGDRRRQHLDRLGRTTRRRAVAAQPRQSADPPGGLGASRRSAERSGRPRPRHPGRLRLRLRLSRRPGPPAARRRRRLARRLEGDRGAGARQRQQRQQSFRGRGGAERAHLGRTVPVLGMPGQRPPDRCCRRASPPATTRLSPSSGSATAPPAARIRCGSWPIPAASAVRPCSASPICRRCATIRGWPTSPASGRSRRACGRWSDPARRRLAGAVRRDLSIDLRQPRDRPRGEGRPAGARGRRAAEPPRRGRAAGGAVRRAGHADDGAAPGDRDRGGVDPRR